MYTITKQFVFCYAHRLFGYPGQCGNIHGHTAKVAVSCDFATLPQSGMAIDFRLLKEKIGNWLDENFDHKLILDKADPVAAKLKELGEDILTLDFPPSAENLARQIFLAAKGLDLPVTKVSFRESPTSLATYVEDK